MDPKQAKKEAVARFKALAKAADEADKAATASPSEAAHEVAFHAASAASRAASDAYLKHRAPTSYHDAGNMYRSFALAHERHRDQFREKAAKERAEETRRQAADPKFRAARHVADANKLLEEAHYRAISGMPALRAEYADQALHELRKAYELDPSESVRAKIREVESDHGETIRRHPRKNVLSPLGSNR